MAKAKKKLFIKAFIEPISIWRNSLFTNEQKRLIFEHCIHFPWDEQIWIIGNVGIAKQQGVSWDTLNKSV